MMRALTLALPLALFACSGDSEKDEEEHEHTHEHEDQAVTLDFEAWVGTEAAACGTDYSVGGGTAQLADARLFLSDIEVEVDGEWHSLTLDDTDWQNDGVALLDFEDGSGACADSGTGDLNSSITGMAPDGELGAVRFMVGVPFELNHLDSAMAPAPLNTPGMFWTWQGGYKFVRVDWVTDGGARWNVHVGSTGCVSDAPTSAPAEVCDNPNAATLEVAADASAPIGIDLGALVAGADFANDTADSPPGCMSSPAEPNDCTPTFDALGLDFATGTCAGDCAGQTLIP